MLKLGLRAGEIMQIGEAQIRLNTNNPQKNVSITIEAPKHIEVRRFAADAEPGDTRKQ